MTTTQAVDVRQKKQDQLVGWLRQREDDIAMAAASHIKPSAIIRVTQGALRRDPKLAAAAVANPLSLLNALLDCARLGHEPDTDDYYLVPFGDEVTGIEGYKGIIERMYRAGGVTSVVAQVVHLFDRYTPRGENAPPWHEYDDFAPRRERGPMRGAYAYAILRDGQCSQVIRMGEDEIMQHKAMSRGSGKPDSPWQKWPAAMWKKTVLKALEPYVPTSAEYRTATAPARQDPYVISDFKAAAVLGERAAPVLQLAGDGERSADAAPDETPASGPAASAGPDDEEPAAPPQAATSGQLSIIGRALKKLGVEDGQRQTTLGQLAGRDLADGPPLTQDEALTIKDLLDKCRGDGGALIELLATGQLPEPQQAGDGDG